MVSSFVTILYILFLSLGFSHRLMKGEEVTPFRPSPACASGEKSTEVISPTVGPYMKPTHAFKQLRFEEWSDEE
jgi:hypothetical protein